MESNLLAYQAETQQQLEQYLQTLVPPLAGSRLNAAMRYSLFAGGKRLRPLLVRAAAESVGAPPRHWMCPAAALEMVHTYSLIHDDLPSMDDDDLRRGQPTNHRQFDEATAILAGDALQSLAFEHVASCSGLDSGIRLQMVGFLARQAGSGGMVGGQMLDLQAEGQSLTQGELEHIHRLKTGALIEAALLMGAWCGGQVSDSVEQGLQQFGQAVGLAFQITDDILDVTANTETLGKPQGSDVLLKKATYVQLLGLEGAQLAAREQISHAISALQQAGLTEAQPLHWLADYVLHRKF